MKGLKRPLNFPLIYEIDAKFIEYDGQNLSRLNPSNIIDQSLNKFLPGYLVLLLENKLKDVGQRQNSLDVESMQIQQLFPDELSHYFMHCCVFVGDQLQQRQDLGDQLLVLVL